MKPRLPIPFLVAACLGWISPALGAPVVTNLTASQRTGTLLVDIAYDVAAPGFPTVAVSLEISSDAGATWTIPTTAATGHVGPGVAPGTGKAIVWNAGEDWAVNYSTQMRFRVVADDGVFAPSGFAFIPGGSFTMGATSGDTDSDAPPVTVTLSSFYMAETETTKAQWDAVRIWAAGNGYSDLPVGGGKASNHPVQTVSWWDVVKWCNARSEMEGLTPVYTVGGNVMRTGTPVPTVNWSANGYRLPTEAEWEKAARGGVAGKRFPWGTDTISHAEANFRTTDYHPTYATGVFPYTSPVGSFAANGFGLKDMSGNVLEWCWDWYGAGTYVGGATDPRGPASGTVRVIRGGGWGYIAIYARASNRITFGTPSGSLIDIGFRSARSSVPTNGNAETGNVTVDTRSDNADLSSLTLSSGTLDPGFASGTIIYTASVDNATTSITVTPARAEANATIEARVNGGAYAPVGSGSPSGSLALNVGTNTVDVRVTAQAGNTKTYTLTMMRRAVPMVISPTSTSITATGATLGGNVTADGAAAITERGVVYAATATNSAPFIGGSGVTKVTGSGTTGAFTAPVTGLEEGTTYSFKAYASNSDGTFYSEVAFFVTDTDVVFESGSATFNRSILPGGRQVFNFTLTGPRIVSLSTLGNGALRAELFDSEGNLIASFDGDTNFDLEELLLAGGYAVHVFREEDGGLVQTFDLTIDASVVAASRPDVAVGASPGALTGRSVYSPARQLVNLTSRRLRAVTGHAGVSNRGKLPDVLAVSGGRGTAFFKVVWSGPTGNITAALNAGTYRTTAMADGNAPVLLAAKITPNKGKLTRTNKKTKRKTIVKKTFRLTLRASSTFDPAISDAATIQVKTK